MEDDRPSYLCESEHILDGLRMGEVGVWRWRIDSDRLQWSSSLEEIHQLPAGSFDGSIASFQRDIHPDDTDAVWQHIRHTLETGAPYRAVYRTAPGKASETLWIEACGGIVTEKDGTRYLTGVCQNITQRMRNELELQRRLHQQQAVERLGSLALNETDFQRVLDMAVKSAAEVLNVPLTKVLQLAHAADHLVLRAGVGWNEGLVGTAAVEVDSESQAGYTLAHKDPVVVDDLLSETRFNGPALLNIHGVRSGMSVVIAGSDKRPFGVFGVHTRHLHKFDQADVEFLTSLANIVANSARQHAAKERHTLLVREMAHRAGNMLQIVNTIARQTFGPDRDVEEAKRSFVDRLASLARANYLIAEGGWTSTSFRSLLEETLLTFRERLELSGRDILLAPDLSFDLGLVLHELATNSAKYGTLNADKGQIRVSWTLSRGTEEDGVFQLVWDDPVVTRTAPRSGTGGFGSRLMAALIEQKWGGTIDVDTDAGYRCSMMIPRVA